MLEPSPKALALDNALLCPTVIAGDGSGPVISNVTGAFWETTPTTIGDPFFDRPSVVESLQEL
jgi:hypothetical protein